ncbi:uncharacterized protein LOC121419449 [Lytechinus variegatus]|uniref:uncharacterized protein LOC121419449 n=1 Tax=Lytechinus variegatus TaxID=7654 RepID=UPI001BB1E359|nr:uncharacterized protein LOC121419449 [Lytechinus variegatus]
MQRYFDWERAGAACFICLCIQKKQLDPGDLVLVVFPNFFSNYQIHFLFRMEDMTELPNEKPMQERGENEGNPMRYPPRQFAATPDPENPHRVLRVDGEELRIARDRNNVPEITIESMTSTTEESKDDAHDGGDEEGEQQSVVRDKKESEEKENTENESQRIDFGKPVERVASPMKPRPSSPIPGRRPQIPLMALVVGAAVEKSRLDDTLGSDEAIYQQSASKYNSLLNPRDNQVSRKSLVAEIMQTDPHGNKLERAPSLGRYQPMGSDDVSLLRPSEMQSYKSRSSSETQHSVSQSEKLSPTESAGKESIEVTKETDTDKGISFLKKFLGARGSDSGPVSSADKVCISCMVIDKKGSPYYFDLKTFIYRGNNSITPT